MTEDIVQIEVSCGSFNAVLFFLKKTFFLKKKKN